MQLPAQKLTEGNRNAVAKVANMASLEEQRMLLGEIKLRFGRVCHGGGVVCVGGGLEAGHICRPDYENTWVARSQWNLSSILVNTFTD